MFWQKLKISRYNIAYLWTCTVQKCTAIINFQIVALCRDITVFHVINSVEVAFRY